MESQLLHQDRKALRHLLQVLRGKCSKMGLILARCWFFDVQNRRIFLWSNCSQLLRIEIWINSYYYTGGQPQSSARPDGSWPPLLSALEIPLHATVPAPLWPRFDGLRWRFNTVRSKPCGLAMSLGSDYSSSLMTRTLGTFLLRPKALKIFTPFAAPRY